MDIIAGYKANKAIAKILSLEHRGSPEGVQSIANIKKIGAPAIPKLIDALDSTQNTNIIQNLLIGLLSSSTLPLFIDPLLSNRQRIVDGVTHILAKSHEYDPNKLLEQFSNPDIPKNALGQILLAQKDRVNVNTVLSLIDKVSSNTRPIIYKIIDKLISEDALPSVISKIKSNEPMVRTYLASQLGRFNTFESNRTLVNMLQDPNKYVRQGALKGLQQHKTSHNTQAICALLKDPDLTVQSVAIDVLIAINAADTVKYLVEILQDESEYIRRAAVEVLNIIGDQRAIKDLLNALRDADWWVKVRAADALGTIGGPKVFDAVLLLIKDKDEFMRRTAVEILNTSKDIRAFDHLLDALRDEDWWVRERAADALAALGDTRAVQPLIDVLDMAKDGQQVFIRALNKLGDQRAIKPLLKKLDDSNVQIRMEALDALQELTDEDHANMVQNAVTQLMSRSTVELKSVAKDAMNTLIGRFGSRVNSDTDPDPASDPLLTPDLDIASELESYEKVTIGRDIIDAALLRPDDIFAERYQIIKQVGKGAFGVVVLVEDILVRDQFILKFLNPHVAMDEHMIRRFTHELRYARKVTHENIIRIYDFITYGRNYAISMEYFESHPLTTEIAKGNLLDHSRALNIIRFLCRGMAAAQEAQVVHRDLKPGNILISDDNTVKIVDFGLAAAASAGDSRLTKTGILVGTPTYMAPEQVRGKEIDSRTDIYATGIIMYEIFTGQAPYTGEESMSIMFQHVEGKAVPPGALVADLPKEIEKIIVKAMAIKNVDRYQHFNELLQDIDNIIGDANKWPV